MKGFIEFLEKRFVPIAAKIGAQRHLVAIRDGFVAIMPIIIAGGIATLINNLPIEAYQDFMPRIFGEGWKNFGGNIWWGTFAMMSIFISFTVAYSLAKSYDVNPLAAGVMSLCNYFIFVPQTSAGAWGNISVDYTGAVALFGALLVALVTGEIFSRLSMSEKLRIKMPEQVPPAVANSFSILLPTMITITIATLISLLVTRFDTNIYTFFTEALQKPLMKLGNTPVAAVFIAFINHFLWFFGLHGSNIIDPVMQAVFVPTTILNAEAIAAGLKPTYIVTKSFFDAFVYMGGSGTTISLIIAIFIASKRKHHRYIAGFSTPMGLFNINESVVFGLPIVLNPLFFFPFILVPVILTIVAYIFTAIGLVPHTSVIIPWTTPPILGGWFATGGHFMGAIMSLINLALGTIIYLPFIVIAERIEDRKAKEGVGA